MGMEHRQLSPMNTNLKAIESKRLYQQVAEQLAGLIEGGMYQPGDRLPAERDLAQQLGVSRPTVREAMIALELMNLVEVRTGAGIFVLDARTPAPVTLLEANDPGPSAFELIQARRVIEGETAAIAAESRNSNDLAALWAAIEKMEADIESGNQSVSNREDGDFLFHSRIAAISRNSVLMSIVDQLWAGKRHPLFEGVAALAHLRENARRAAGDHRMIYEEIKSGDPERARAAMQKHLDQVRDVLLETE